MFSSSSTILPINQRKWNDIPAVGRIDDTGYKILTLMTRLSRHEGYPREDDEEKRMEKVVLYVSARTP